MCFFCPPRALHSSTYLSFHSYNTLMSRDTASVAEILKLSGYNTAWIGKNVRTNEALTPPPPPPPTSRSTHPLTHPPTHTAQRARLAEQHVRAL